MFIYGWKQAVFIFYYGLYYVDLYVTIFNSQVVLWFDLFHKVITALNILTILPFSIFGRSLKRKGWKRGKRALLGLVSFLVIKACLLIFSAFSCHCCAKWSVDDFIGWRNAKSEHVSFSRGRIQIAVGIEIF